MRISDWSSDVCSSDLEGFVGVLPADEARHLRVDLARKVRIGGLHRCREGQRVEVERVAGDDVDRAADAAFLDVGLRAFVDFEAPDDLGRSEEHTSELQSLMRISYAVFCLKKKNPTHTTTLTDKMIQ